MIFFTATAVALAMLSVFAFERLAKRYPLFDHLARDPLLVAINLWGVINDVGLPAVSAIVVVGLSFFHIRHCRRLASLRDELADHFGERHAPTALRRLLAKGEVHGRFTVVARVMGSKP